MATLIRPDGTRLFYQVIGKDTGRPPLVFIHGWCSNQEHWVHQASHFRKRHRVLLLDRRGHGRSTTSGAGHDPATHAADFAALTAAAGLKRVLAIGHAGGGAGTLAFIRDNPRLVRAGVLIDTGLSGPPPAPAANSPLAAVIERLRGPQAKSVFKTMYASYFHPKGDRAAARQAVADAARTPDAVKIAELHGLMVDTAAIADGIAQPVLWLTAAGANQAFIRAHLKNVAFAQVYGANHFPHFEQPAQTNAMIEAFLTRI